MAIITQIIIYFVAFLCGLVGILYVYIANKYTYWSKRGIPFIPGSFPFGCIKDVVLMRIQISQKFIEFYKRFEGNKYGGVFQFHRPTLVLRDPETIKNFMTRDFASFHDRGIYVDEKNDPISAHLFLISGQRWRNLRAKLTPTFTSGKMKMMFHTMLECGIEFKNCLKKTADISGTIELKDMCARYTTDVIASCAFGVQCNSLKDPQAEFRQRGREYFEPTIKFSIGGLLNVMAPTLASKVSWGHTPKHISDFFRGMVRETVEYREKNDVTRNDFMQLMIQLKNQGYVDVDKTKDSEDIVQESNTSAMKKLTIDEISAQAFVFFLGGFETSSSTMSFCLYELALNPDIQTHLRHEVNEVLEKHGGNVTYDAILEMEYLDKVVAETLRKYPPLGILNRECTVAYKLPDSDVVLEPGTQVVVPVLALHHDPQYYPEPERFDPERFAPEAKAARHHYTYLPFGEGPRNCIGMRFGYMQTKVGLISMLTSYEVKVTEKTTIPLIIDPKSFTLCAKGGIFLQVVNRSF